MIPLPHPPTHPFSYQASSYSHPSPYLHLQATNISHPRYYKSPLTDISAPTFGLNHFVTHCTATRRIFLKYISDLFTPLINSIWFHSIQFLSWVNVALRIFFLHHSPASPLEMNESLPFQPLPFTSWSWSPGHCTVCSSSLHPTTNLLELTSSYPFQNSVLKLLLPANLLG